MKKSKFLAVVAFVAAVASVFAFTPPPTPYGFHTSLGCVSGTIVGTNNCDKQSGSDCQVKVGSGSTAQIVDAYASAMGCSNTDSNDRLRRPNQ